MATQHPATVLITGGAGFVGCNLAERFLTETDLRVRIFDNLSRKGVKRNLDWLQTLPGAERLEVQVGDVRDPDAVNQAAAGAEEIYHLAAQVAVTTSVENPALDFEVNALGTFHILEAARRSDSRPFVLFTSTNKVYGSLEGVPVQKLTTRYAAQREEFAGVTEEEPLDFHSPYGCSKGAADQYVRDYARIYGIDATVFRMSCIAGPRQFGNEDQGWVAHFLYSVLQEQTITICGDGLQVRDILHVHDLVDAMMLARKQRQRVSAQVYNVGGGPARTVSVQELLQECSNRTEMPLHLDYVAMRPGDQPLYVSNTGKLERHIGWAAQRSLDDILNDIESFWHTEQGPRAQRGSLFNARQAEPVAEEVA